MHTQAEWQELFAGDGAKFKSWMKAKWTNPEVAAFVDSDKFNNKYMEDLKDFCVEFAKDGGKVPSC